MFSETKVCEENARALKHAGEINEFLMARAEDALSGGTYSKSFILLGDTSLRQ